MKKPSLDSLFSNARFSTFLQVIKKSYSSSIRILHDSSLTNLQRLYYASMISIPAFIVSILLFLTAVSSDTPARALWRQGILLSHSTLLALMIVFFCITRRLKKSAQSTTFIRAFQYFAISAIMAAGVVIVSIDQLVTNSITPFLVACVVVSTIFLIRPIYAFVIYFLSFVSYYFAIGLTAPPNDVLLSNRVNGIMAIGIGIALCLIMWRNYCVTTKQRQCIESQKAELEQMALYDSLTGLSNRRYFDELIRKEIAAMHRSQNSSCIVVLDIDDFKKVNDTYGHPAGDCVLKQLSALLKRILRDTDTIARLGGEEFIILLPNTSLKQSSDVAEKIRRRVEEEAFVLNSEVVHITASFGISLLCGNEEHAFFNYYAYADKALYKAKSNGKNRVEIAACNLAG